MERMFTITNHHLKLLEKMFVGWQDCEFGAPEIDPKRPYGNSNVLNDIAQILGIRTSVEIDSDEFEGYTEAEKDHMNKIHTETQLALQCILSNIQLGDFKGLYFKEDNYDSTSWRRKYSLQVLS